MLLITRASYFQHDKIEIQQQNSTKNRHFQHEKKLSISKKTRGLYLQNRSYDFLAIFRKIVALIKTNTNDWKNLVLHSSSLQWEKSSYEVTAFRFENETARTARSKKSSTISDITLVQKITFTLKNEIILEKKTLQKKKRREENTFLHEYNVSRLPWIRF